jgi:hypothetical protein
VCWRDSEVNTGTDMTDSGYELWSLSNSLCGRYTDNREIKNKTLFKDKQKLTFLNSSLDNYT